MRMMLIYFVVAIAAYQLAGVGNRFTQRMRLYFAIGAFAVTYLITMAMTFIDGGL